VPPERLRAFFYAVYSRCTTGASVAYVRQLLIVV
jgi:hypothetical protein